VKVLISITETSERLGISRQAVLKRINAGKLPAVKVGRQYVIKIKDLK
jgi:excisionase family DNA binding protein